MIKHYPYQKLGHANHGWLDARHHFSFASYHNPARMNFGTLRVVNDDIIKAGRGFDTYPHKNMEIITYVRKGAITHKDSYGNVGRTKAGDIQVMSAGSGIHHSEHNFESEDTTLYQIWIEPNQHNVTPAWAAHQFPLKTTNDQLELLVGPKESASAPLHIYQDAYIYAGNLASETVVNQPIKHQAYILVSHGAIEIEGQTAHQGDAFEVTKLNQIQIKCLNKAEILVIDCPRR